MPKFEPKLRHVLEELGEIHSGGTQQCVFVISLVSVESIAFHSMFGFEVADAWFDGGSSFHPFPE